MKTLVITGASKGIGLAVASLCLEEDYRVINLSRTPAPDARIDNLPIDLASPEADVELAKMLNTPDSRRICLGA
jgi:short-subunit dehydrogenase